MEGSDLQEIEREIHRLLKDYYTAAEIDRKLQLLRTEINNLWSAIRQQTTEIDKLRPSLFNPGTHTHPVSQ